MFDIYIYIQTSPEGITKDLYENKPTSVQIMRCNTEDIVNANFIL